MRHITVNALVALALVFAPLSGAGAATISKDDKAAALLAKHRAYVGWQFGDDTFRTMRVTGNITNSKGVQTAKMVTLWDGLVYHTTSTLLDRGDVTEHTGYTGNLFWQSNINGFTTPVYGDEAKFLASWTLLMREGTSGLTGSFVENKTIDGKAVAIVRVSLTKGDPIDLAIDPDTGAYVAATVDPDGAYETTYHFLSYQDVLPGKKLVSSFRMDEDKDVHTYTSFEPNIPVSDGDLHPPGPTATWTFGDGSPYPITMTHDRMLIDVAVNGVKGRFILDTGSDSIVLDDRFADKVNATALKGGTEAFTMYGDVPTRVRKTSTITVGGSTLANALVFSQDFRHGDARGLDREGYDGLMGFDLFAAAIVKLDVYGSKITILDPLADLSGEKGLPILVDVSDGVPTIPMVLNKSIDVNAMLDTGNPGIIYFGPDLRKKRGLKIPECGVLSSLAIGPITYANEQACDAGFAANYMLLGFDFLKHFDYVFDYPHGRMFMSPNKN